MFLAAAVLARHSNLAGFAPDAGDDTDAALSNTLLYVRRLLSQKCRCSEDKVWT